MTAPGGEAIANPMRLERPLKVTISYTHSCNLDCVHCYADCTRTPSARELPAERWQAFLDEQIENGIVAALFEGGEPFHRADFLDVLRHCARRLLARVRTNGTLVTPALAAELREIGVGTVLVDVMGARAETHEAMTRTPGSFAQSRAGVRALVAAGVPTQMLMIMTRHNAGEIQDLLGLAGDLGVTTVGILRPYPIGRARRAWREIALPLADMTAALDRLRVPAGMKLMHSWHPNDGNCCWEMAAVNAWGDSIGCTYLREFVHYGNIAATPFLETWQHPLYRALRSGRVERSCGECAEREGSHGGCRASAFAFHGRWTAPDPFDVTLNQRVDLRELPDWMLPTHPGPPRAPGAGGQQLPGLHAAGAAALYVEPERLADPGAVPGPDRGGA